MESHRHRQINFIHSENAVVGSPVEVLFFLLCFLLFECSRQVN